MLQDRKIRLEQEEEKIKERLELQRKKTEGWELYRLSKNFLEQNDTRWKKRKEKEQLENERIARLEVAMVKGSKGRLQRLEQDQEQELRNIHKKFNKIWNWNREKKKRKN